MGPRLGSRRQKLNFAISSIHVRALKSRASNVVHPWSTLPHGKGGSEFGGGDADKTFAAWKKFNLALFEFNKRLADADKKLDTIPKPDPRWPMRGSNTRLKRYVSAFKAYATAYGDFAMKTKDKAIDPKGIDPYLAKWIENESFVLEKTAKSYKELATSVAVDKMENGAFAHWKVTVLKMLLDSLHSDYDRIRLVLGIVYARDFPTPEQSAAEEEKILASKPGATPGRKLPKHANPDDEIGYRVWTTADGKFSVEAKYLGVTDDGQSVKLKKRNGKTKEVAIDRLCDADQSYITAAREVE